MKTLIIGATTNFGKEVSKKLYSLGYDIICVSKLKRKLDDLKKEMENAEIIQIDVASIYNCKKLYNKVIDENIDFVINCEEMENNEEFIETKIDKDLDLIDINVKSMHTLTKLFLKYFQEKNEGKILNICSCDAFLEKNANCTYNASKSYILSLTSSLSEELKFQNSNVYIGCYCLSDKQVDLQVEEALDGLNKGKVIIVPKELRFKKFLNKILPRKKK